ncbi:MAG: AAA family ATPase [Clostridia bacterium]
MSKIISFANQKGGVGKTTTCLNVSSYLALMGKKVLMIDIDPQGNATSGLGISKEKGTKSIYDVLVGGVKPNEAILKTPVPLLEIIPANIDLAGVEVELVYMDNRESVLKKIITRLKNDYDFITIDCPPSLGLLTINALTCSDSVCIPIQCEFFALEGLSQLMNTIRLVKKRLNSQLAIEGVVLTMRDSRSNLGQQVAEEICKYFASTVFKTTIPRNIKIAEAPSHGLPIYMYDKNCAGAIAYEKLTEEILDRNEMSYNKITKNKKKGQ